MKHNVLSFRSPQGLEDLGVGSSDWIRSVQCKSIGKDPKPAGADGTVKSRQTTWTTRTAGVPHLGTSPYGSRTLAP